LEENGLTVARGQFRAHMQVTLTNDGPVTILLDSRKLF
ncbi:MAG: D-tyrosyl-tRNA(Tyr) deacylase, partial [Clostridiales bacterium]|nr:D-tyrosyl-tRNA(Tyr) deacylase [Clostridiales bacterium]